MSPLLERFLGLYETTALLVKQGFSGPETQRFGIKTGSRLVFSLWVGNLSGGANVLVTFKNGFSQDVPLDTVLQINATANGYFRRIITDFHNIFEIDIQVIGGTADVALGVTVNDNALSTRIENAEIEVDLDHVADSNGEFDSVRVGDGTTLVRVRKAFGVPDDGSLDIFDIGYSKDSRIKRRLLCSPDLKRKFTHADVDGIWRVSQIEYTSASLDANMTQTVKLTKTFTYLGADPFTVDEVQETLTVT